MILKQEEDLALIRGAWICLKFIKVADMEKMSLQPQMSMSLFSYLF